MEIQQGLMLNLKCRVQGERDPDIRWYKDGQPINPERHPNVEISSGVKRSQLRVRNVQLSDSGNYSCIGSSENAELSKWVYVTGEFIVRR
ncbi:immunoglobulin domain protein [Opisthorchis viverrini]|uniref:Immunoglobulin domain protein n=1 Tax=Opisthorchis viverrini TaxID=6198 RepID=A0A1S8WLB5_OPIVI|nr:immunoglobulin domain protein [Opisthorchis viverrini]